MLTKIAAWRARKLWKNFVLKNHHKDRDFQVIILEDGSLYDKNSRYFVAFIPNPYLLDEGCCSDFWFSKNCAEIDLILAMFNKMGKWVEHVLDNQDDYDVEQRNQAKYWERTEKERRRIHHILYSNLDNKAEICDMRDIKEFFNVN